MHPSGPSLLSSSHHSHPEAGTLPMKVFFRCFSSHKDSFAASNKYLEPPPAKAR